MGYMRHHAIVVTASDSPAADTALNAAEQKALDLGCSVTPIVDGAINGYQSFLVAPDGSKEGWSESSKGDAQRAALIEFMDTFRFEDGSSPLAWVEVQFGDDNLVSRVVRHSDEKD